jgi:hypothetical protein
MPRRWVNRMWLQSAFMALPVVAREWTVRARSSR